MKAYFDAKQLGDDIVAYRTKNDTGIRELSAKTGLSVNMLFRMELGKTAPRADDLHTLCTSIDLDRNKYFKVSMNLKK